MINFIEKCSQMHNNFYDYSLVRYTSTRSKITIICPYHGEFEQRAKNHLAGQGCPKCKTRKLSHSLTLDINEFLLRANEIHHSKYDYSKAQYITSSQKIIIICPTHGEFQQTPNSHLNGRGCPNCGRSRNLKYNYRTFLSKARHIHSDKYLYNFFEDKTTNSKIDIVCGKHGLFKQTIKSHLAGYGCPKCARSIESAQDKIARFNQIHNNKYTYSEIIDASDSSIINIICPEHGEFKQSINNHLAKHGCPKCGIVGGWNKLSTDQFIEKARSIHGDAYDYSPVQYIDYKSKVIINCPNHGKFHQTPSNHIAGNGCPKCNTSRSKAEQEIYEFISSLYSKEIIRNSRDIIYPYELDIYIPEFNLAIEHNGDYFHSYGVIENSKQKLKHSFKYDLCVSNGIKLLQFFEFEWLNKRPIVESIIRHHLGLSNRIYARKCEISNGVPIGFFDSNHMQGDRSASVGYSLVYDGEVVACMSFMRHPKYEWEIARFANLVNNSVVGGASKLFRRFINDHCPKTVLTYADRRVSLAELYFKLQFVSNGFTKPGYSYWKSGKILSRQKCQKRKLNNFLSLYDESLSEAANMFANGYRRLWDAGHHRLIWENEDKVS